MLNHVFEYRNKKYLLEIGKTVAAINQYNRPLQRVALYSLAGLIAITLIFDLLFTRLLLRPLGIIIRSKLQHRKFPFKEIPAEVNTSTSDFKYLDRSLISLMTKIREAFEKEREFTSNASHELMTPISILQNKIENLLMDGDITEASQDKISGMLITLQRLKKIVRALLLISRIENEQFAKMEEVLPQVLLNEVVEELQDKLDARSIRVVQTISTSNPLRGINRDLLFQLFYNLVNNAIRYNKEGGSIHISETYSLEKGYAIVITDTGIGIPENELAMIFDRFKKSGKTTEEGYGLGLSIVKSIALYHQISIEVSSETGKGSVFSVFFPSAIIQ